MYHNQAGCLKQDARGSLGACQCHSWSADKQGGSSRRCSSGALQCHTHAGLPTGGAGQPWCFALPQTSREAQARGAAQDWCLPLPQPTSRQAGNSSRSKLGATVQASPWAIHQAPAGSRTNRGCIGLCKLCRTTHLVQRLGFAVPLVGNRDPPGHPCAQLLLAASHLVERAINVHQVLQTAITLPAQQGQWSRGVAGLWK